MMNRNWIEYYGETQAIDRLLFEAAEEFDGEDPPIPEIRAILNWMRAELEELHVDLKNRHQVDIALPEPSAQRLAVIKRIAHGKKGRDRRVDSDQA